MLLHCYVNHYTNNRPYEAVLFVILDQMYVTVFRKQSSKKDRIEVTSEKSSCYLLIARKKHRSIALITYQSSCNSK